MKMLIWLTQLGLCVALPLTGFTFLGSWLHRSLGWGIWAISAGIISGLICAVQNFRDSLKIMEQLSRQQNQESPPVSFNAHK